MHHYWLFCLVSSACDITSHFDGDLGYRAGKEYLSSSFGKNVRTKLQQYIKLRGKIPLMDLAGHMNFSKWNGEVKGSNGYISSDIGKIAYTGFKPQNGSGQVKFRYSFNIEKINGQYSVSAVSSFVITGLVKVHVYHPDVALTGYAVKTTSGCEFQYLQTRVKLQPGEYDYALEDLHYSWWQVVTVRGLRAAAQSVIYGMMNDSDSDLIKEGQKVFENALNDLVTQAFFAAVENFMNKGVDVCSDMIDYYNYSES